MVEYTKSCLTCQQDKVDRKKLPGLLESLPIPSKPCESVSLDLIISLLKMEELMSILVVVDRFSKYATFITAPKKCPIDETACLFLQNVVKYWGAPQNIVND